MKDSLTISYRSPSSLADLAQDSPVLLALSGGEDSRVLLDLLAEDARHNSYTLVAAHFNHKIRGEEAERDAEFCRTLAESYNISFVLGSADVPRLAKEHGTGIEEEARAQRYAFFESVMIERGIKLLATAHHAQDQAETVLLHVLRGSGIGGLRGILPCRQFGGGYIVRPLLEVEKSDISQYAREHGLKFVTDSTNSDDTYARNFLRSRVIPLLTELQPSLTKSLARLAENAGQADSLIGEQAQELLNRTGYPIPLSELSEVHIAVRARVLSTAFEEFSGGSHLEKVHTDALLALCESARPHSSVSLPSGMRGTVEHGAIIFTEDTHTRTEVRTNYRIPLAEGTYSPCEGVKIEISRVDGYGDIINKKDKMTLCLPHSLADGAILRPRREGDTVRLRGMTKSVRKLMNEKKLTLRKRAVLPMLVRDEEVLWIPSLAICDSIADRACPEDSMMWRIAVSIDTDSAAGPL